jgi:cytochrome c biogenesis protein CcmG, thiol:disulfide interchange protein DsbE
VQADQAERPRRGGTAKARRRPRSPVAAIALAGSAVLLALLLAVLWLAARPAGRAPEAVRFGAPTPPRPLAWRPVAPGTPAPALALPGLDGGTVDLAAYRGRPVVVNFWASWCEPCKRELPLLAEAVRRAGGDLAVIGVVVRDDPAAARAMAARYQARWPMAVDRGERVAGAWRVALLPQSFFVRADGTIASQQPGELTRAGLREQLERVGAG